MPITWPWNVCFYYFYFGALVQQNLVVCHIAQMIFCSK